MEWDLASCDEIIKNDDAIDEMEKEIEQLCIKLLLQQQPVATDLRFITSALKMVTDMERIGDHAEDIADLMKKMYTSSNSNKDVLGKFINSKLNEMLLQIQLELPEE